MAAATDDPLIGRTLAGCQIEKRIGSGGMGVVYLCRQLSLDRPVVAKILHGELTRRPEFVKRFEREAKAAARLFHPNVVQVLDHGREAGLYYIIMEYVDGVTVKDLIEARGSIALDRTARIVADTARGLGAAHRAGVVHRDVKPANIMINSEGVVKLADFGIAKPIDDAEEITQTNFLVGTVQYMSPEQCDGQEIDGRADIYSLGVTFFQMLTGHRPFEGKSTVDLMRQHIHDPPPPIERYILGVPADVSRILCRMLAKMPGDRYASCDAVVAELEALATRRSSESSVPTREFPMERTGGGSTAGRPAPAGGGTWVALLVLAAFVAAGGVYAWYRFGWPIPEFAARARDDGRPKDPARGNGTGPVVGPVGPGPGPVGPGPGPGEDPLRVEALERARAELESGALAAALESARSGLARWGAQDWGDLVASVEEAVARDMVRVEAGPAWIGDDADPLASPRHRVTLPEYWIDRYEVSNEAYARFVRATGARPPRDWTEGAPPRGREQHPVTSVEPDEARSYAEWVGKRLPTEEEWEKAARGPDGDMYPWGGHLDAQLAVLDGETVAVDDRPRGRSPCGAEQMIGNVWEWTSDRLVPYPGSKTRPEDFPPGERVVIRGGGFGFPWGFDLERSMSITTASRWGVEPARLAIVGFRCVWDGPRK